MTNYNNMNKSELVERLNKIDAFDPETLAVQAVVNAIKPFAPKSYYSPAYNTNRRDEIARILRHAAERYEVSL